MIAEIGVFFLKCTEIIADDFINNEYKAGWLASMVEVLRRVLIAHLLLASYTPNAQLSYTWIGLLFDDNSVNVLVRG